MPLTAKGEKIKRAMQAQYGAERGKQVFYASENKGTITGVHAGATETALPVDFRWPTGKPLAVFFRCAFEGWSDGHWPGIGPMGNPLKSGVPDLNAIGFAEYGHRRGIFRVLDTLRRENVKATLIVSGIMAERHAAIVSSNLRGGA